jgi:hypothetical protein
VSELLNLLNQQEKGSRHVDRQLASVVQAAYSLSNTTAIDNEEERTGGIVLGLETVGRKMCAGFWVFRPELKDSFFAEDFADSENDSLRAYAAKSMGVGRSVSGLATLEKLTNDKDEAVVLQAVWSMARLGPSARHSIPLLGRMARDESRGMRIRRAAIVALGAVESVEALPELRSVAEKITIVADEYESIKSCILALARTGAKDAARELRSLQERIRSNGEGFAEGQRDRLANCVEAALARLGDMESCERLVSYFKAKGQNDPQDHERAWVAGLLMFANNDLARDALYQAWKMSRNDWIKAVFGYYLKSYVPRNKKEIYPEYWKWWCANAIMYADSLLDLDRVNQELLPDVEKMPNWKEVLISY